MILDDLLNEIERAVAKHGPLPIGVDPSVRLVGACAAAERVARIATDQSPTWSALAVLVEEVGEAARAEDSAELRAELVQVAAVALRWAAQLSGEDAGAALRGRTFGGER